MTRRLGILGGTFDPVHAGHLATAAIAQEALGLDVVRFVPSRTPPHRDSTPRASAFHRFAMVALAVAGHDRFLASDEELRESGPSYTWNTLSRLHDQGISPRELYFVLGMDAFHDIASWHRYPEVLDAAQFVVVTRPGAAPVGAKARLATLNPRMVEAGAFAPATDDATKIVLVPGATPDVSSTEVRRRIEAGEPLTGLVPTPVVNHINRHGLYR